MTVFKVACMNSTIKIDMSYQTFLSTNTNYHHNSIIKLSIRWCVWKVGEGFSRSGMNPDNKLVYSSVMSHTNEYHWPCV